MHQSVGGGVKVKIGFVTQSTATNDLAAQSTHDEVTVEISI